MRCTIIKKKRDSYEVYRNKLLGKVFIDRKPSFALAKKIVIAMGCTHFDYEDKSNG